MADKSAIEWTDATWNPVRGCSRVSPGCGGPNHEGGCYAEKIAARFSGPGQPFEGFAVRTPYGGAWTGKLAIVESQIDLPLRWKKPRRIFVNSMSDLFHEALPFYDIARVFFVMTGECSAEPAPAHTYQILTKRGGRAVEFFDWLRQVPADQEPWLWGLSQFYLHHTPSYVWLGVSVEDRERKSRIDELRMLPASVRFLSIEPLLEDLGEFDLAAIHWVIVGAESGPRARPTDLNWVRDIRDQCAAAGVAFFFKQAVDGGRLISLPMLDGRQHAEFPKRT